MTAEEKNTTKPEKRTILFVILTSLFILVLTAFASYKWKQHSDLSEVNVLLLSKIDRIEQELVELRQTADFHFGRAIDFMNESKFEEAKSKFETVIQKYPESSLVKAAKEQLNKVNTGITRIEAKKRVEEERRREAEKYKPRDPYVAIEEWNMFRRNEEKYKGTITTWRFPVSEVRRKDLIGYLDDVVQSIGYKNIVSVKNYHMRVMLEKFPVVIEGDWISVTGEFVNVSSDNVIVLKPIKVINEGYK